MTTTPKRRKAQPKIKPCPFCGEPGKVIRVADYFVTCKRESCSGNYLSYYPSRDRAIDAWNQRAESRGGKP